MINKNILILLCLLLLSLNTEAQVTPAAAKSLLALRTEIFNEVSYSGTSDIHNRYSTLNLVSDNAEVEGITLFSGLGNNIINSFKGDNLYLHLAGVASTVLLVSTNTDYYVHKYFNEHENYGSYARPAVSFGMYFPFAVGGSLYAFGKLNRDDQALAASLAVLQSSLLAFTYNSLLKALTGRPNPRWRDGGNIEELSKEFRFGFWRGGIFWGWPSGHTSSTMAVISALTSFYPDKTWLKIAGYSYVAYMIFSVSALNRGGMHWFSDAVAAAFISYTIGSTVGKHYRSKFKKDTISGNKTEFQYMPVIGYTYHF